MGQYDPMERKKLRRYQRQKGGQAYIAEEELLKAFKGKIPEGQLYYRTVGWGKRQVVIHLYEEP